MPYPPRYDIKHWMSGGGANTYPSASLGGAISTAKETSVYKLLGPQGQILEYPVPGAYAEYDPNWDSWVDSVTYANSGEYDGANWRCGITVWTFLYYGVGYPYPLYVNGGNYNPGSVSATSFGVTPNSTGSGYAAYNYFSEQNYIDNYVSVSVNFSYSRLGVPPPESQSYTIAQYLGDTDRDNLFDAVPIALFGPGTTLYRCFYIKNHNGSYSTPQYRFSFVDNIASFIDGLTITMGLGIAGINGTEEQIADQFTAPIGVVFDEGSDPFIIPPLQPGQYIGVWVKLTIPPAFTPVGDYDRAMLWVRGNAIGYSNESLTFHFSWFYGMVGYAYDDLDLEEEVVFLFNGGYVYDGEASDDFTIEEGDLIAFNEDALEELRFTDLVTPSLIARTTVLDAFVLTEDTPTITGLVIQAVEDNLRFSDSASYVGTMTAYAEDDLIFVEEVELGDEVYDGWVVNADTGAVSKYEWAAFNSFTKYNGVYYGATPDGIMQLDADTDNTDDIESFVLTGVDDFNIPADKRVLRAYLAVKTDGKMLLKTVVGDNQVRVYRVVSTNDSMLSRRVPLGRGVDAYHWQFALQNEDGADFETDCIRVYPVVLKRRFR